MMNPIKSVTDLKKSYQRLPGIGEKTAERLAYATLRFSRDELELFISNLNKVMEKVHRCPNCGLDIDTEECPICDDPSRDDRTLLVVTDARNVISFEKTGNYHGRYFVLGGTISPIRNISPEDIHIDDLLKQIQALHTEEVILACNSTIDGETTALYIASILKNCSVKVSRLAYGLPLGADLEYVDELTISRSLQGRVDITREDD